jgi:hypothetical protein
MKRKTKVKIFPFSEVKNSEVRRVRVAAKPMGNKLKKGFNENSGKLYKKFIRCFEKC